MKQIEWESIEREEIKLLKRLEREEKEKKEEHEQERKEAQERLRGCKHFEFGDDPANSKLGITIHTAQDRTVYFGDIESDSPAGRGGIISGDVPLIKGKPVKRKTFLELAAKRPLEFDVKRYIHQKFYEQSSPAYIQPSMLESFTPEELREMLNSKLGFVEGPRMGKPTLIAKLGLAILEAQSS